MNDESETPNVAIVGRPNVGKSALFNRLVERKIAIVHDQPGVTRDRISALCYRASRPFTVWDTGGVGGAGDSELSNQVQKTAERAISQSELLLLVVDAKQGLSPIDEELGRTLRKSRKPILLVINKIDDPKHEDLASDFARLGFDNVASVSAAHGRGIQQLIETIEKNLPIFGGPAAPGWEDRRPMVPGDQDGRPATARRHGQDSRSTAAALTIAVIGRPNAGKSSLINSIVQSERAIVNELPGTTRDAVDILYRSGSDQFIFIDTAGIRRRGKHSSSAEVFSVMRAERSIRRAALCVLIIDLTTGVTAQDKRIAGLIQKARKGSIVVLNKWDLIKPRHGQKQAMIELVEETRRRTFFLDYAPVLIASARTGENIERLFDLIRKIRRAAEKRIGTGVLNRALRAAFAANPPPMIGGRRLKLFYATQTSGSTGRPLQPPEFVLFVNEPRLLNETYRRYLEARIREEQPYPGLPVILTCRPRSQNLSKPRRLRPN
jgi:GTP-binding protein